MMVADKVLSKKRPENRVKLLRKWLIVAPVVLGLILVGIFIPARQVTIEGIGTLSFETPVTLSVGSEVAYASPGWLSGWSYRRTVNLSPATPIADYQVLVILNTSIMGNPYDNVNPDGSDIRFTASDEPILQNYWIESWDNTGTSRIWVEVTTLGADTIYMYYGNAAASSASDGDATFVFFDDFSTNTLADYDTAKWVDIHGDYYIAPTYDAANQRVTFDTGDNYASDMYPIGLTMADFSMEVDFWADASYPTDATIALVSRLQNPGTSSTHYYMDFSHGSYDSPGITIDSWVNGERSNTVYSEPSDYYWSFNQVHTFRYALFGNNQKFWWNKDITQTPDISVSDATYTSAGRLGLVAAQARGWWDNFRVRWYLEPEPMATVGGEEIAVVSISVSPDKDWGTVVEGQILSTLTTDFTVTNDGNVTVNIDIHGADTTCAGIPWTLSDTATPDPDEYGLQFERDLNPGWITIPTTDVDYMDGLSPDAGSNTDDFGLRLLTPTVISDTINQQTGVITFTAVQAP